jgi:hypothetical protein
MTADTYGIYAVRYAHHDRLARENFLGGGPHTPAVIKAPPPCFLRVR